MLESLADHDPYASIETDLGRARRWHPINRGAFWAAKIHLPGQLLSLKGDRIAMSQSVEMRYPFLDNDVFDFLAGIDPNLKLKGLREKYLLRRVAEKWLPKSIAWRPKGMFRAPLDGFFLNKRLPYVDELLSEESLKKSGYFDPKAVRLWKRKYRELSPLLYQRSSMELGLVAVARDAALAPHLHRPDAGKPSGLANRSQALPPMNTISDSPSASRKRSPDRSTSRSCRGSLARP